MGALPPPQPGEVTHTPVLTSPPPMSSFAPLPGERAWFGQTEARVHFDIATSGILRMAFVGSILQFITVGIYRFWFLVNVRRQLWQRTSLAGSSFEFTGTAGEVFRGFLLSLIFLAPIWGCYFGGSTLANTKDYYIIAHVMTAVAIVGFLFFGYFASYRSGRYRVSRTLWRGVRFRQTGSGFVFACLNFGWWIVAIVTLGLSIPFARAQLERYRTNHMWFGDRKFESRASGLAMLAPWLLLYVVVLGPAAAMFIGWYFEVPDLAQKLQTEFGTYTQDVVRNPRSAQIQLGLIYYQLSGSVWGIGTLLMMSLLSWPLYRARELRSFVGRIHLGTSGLRSDLSAGAVYLAFLAFIASLAGIMFIVAGLSFLSVKTAVSLNHEMASFVPVVATVLGIIGYLVFLLTFSVLRLRILLFGLACTVLQSLVVTNMQSVLDVISQSDTVGAIGDDFAGGFDIGAF